MTLSWTDTDTNVMGFEIYRSVHHDDVDDDVWYKVGYAPAGTTGSWNDQQIQPDITDPDLTTGGTYDYYVRAITGIPDVFSGSSIVDGDGSGIAPAWDGYSNNLAVGWDGESGDPKNFMRLASSFQGAARGPTTNGGWLEYDNVDLPSGATSLNLNLVYFSGSPDMTIKIYYGASPDDGGTLAGSLDLTSANYTTGDTSFVNTPASDFAVIPVSVDIPSGTPNIYIQFVSVSGSPRDYIALANWQFA